MIYINPVKGGVAGDKKKAVMHVKTVAEENIQSRRTSLERVSDEVHFPLGARDAEYPLVVEAWKYTAVVTEWLTCRRSLLRSSGRETHREGL